MSLPTLWFVLVAVLWTGFFVLEGFDFGVGVLHRFVGRDDLERRIVINTVGPFWDGNEVWLIVGGAAIFAAFPDWYATWFSAGYLALVLVLLALIARGVSFEFRRQLSEPRWRATWSWTLTLGSALAPLLLGVALGDLLAGLPIDGTQNFTGSFWDLLTPYGLLVGLTLTVLSVLHGATFLGLRTVGAVRARARTVATRSAWPAAVLTLAFAVGTPWVSSASLVAQLLPVLAALGALATAATALRAGREGWAFAATAATIGLVVVAVFANLYPDVMVSSTSTSNNLTVAGTASGHYALQVMTVVAAAFLPVVLAYQTWTYVVFRRRVTGQPLDSTTQGEVPA